MSFLDVISKLGKSVNTSLPNLKENVAVDSRRYAGGKNGTHPFISGYWQLLFKVPKFINKYTSTENSTSQSKNIGPDIEKWFNITAESFTPPTRTLTNAVFPGIGGVNKSFITGQTLNNSFSIAFREYAKLPLIKIINAWTNVIHNQTGVSPISELDWSESYYKGECIVFITNPKQVTEDVQQSKIKFNRKSIQELYYFYGVYPENNPQDIPQDIASNSTVQIPVNFKFDGWPLTMQDLDNTQFDKVCTQLESIFTIS